MLQKMRLLFRLLLDKRFRLDAQAFQASKPIFVGRAWDLLKELDLKKGLEDGTSLASLMKKGIKNERMLECMLDILVTEKVLKFEQGKYFFLKEPEPITKKQFAFLHKHYSGSWVWVDFVTKKTKQTLVTGKPPLDTGFKHETTLDMWDAIMEESPHSFRKMAIEKLVKKLAPNSNILDLGCGGGIGLETILKHANKPLELTGAEVSYKYLERAKKRLTKLYKETNKKIVKENIKKVKFIAYKVKNGIPKEEKFDAVFMSIVLNHVPEKEREQLFSEIKKILKPKGTLMIYQLIHQSKFERNPICWLMHTVPSHVEYPFREEYVATLKKQFGRVEEHLKGMIIEAWND